MRRADAKAAPPSASEPATSSTTSAGYGALSSFLKKDYQPQKTAVVTSNAETAQLSTQPFARKAAQLSDWLPPVDLSKNCADATSMAQCQEMCAESERTRRAAENDLHKLEQEHPELPGWKLADMAIKKYQRSAADHELKIPSQIRPAPVLLKTLEYMEDQLMEKDFSGPDPRYGGEPVPSLELYLFIWDRFRMICKDFILQDYRFGGLNDECCIEVHERIARWYVMMDHQMRADPEFVKAHAQQNAEQLNSVLKSLSSFYDDARQRGPKVAEKWCKNEAEFRSYFLLYQLDNKDVTQATLATLAPEVLQSPEIRLVLEVMKSRKNQNYARFFRVFKEADYLHACILFKFVGVMRATALRLLSRFFLAPKTKTRYPLDELISLLCFEDVDDAIEFVENCGLVVDTTGDAESSAVLLEGVKLQVGVPPATRFMEHWIESRLEIGDDARVTRKQVCQGLAKQAFLQTGAGAEDDGEQDSDNVEEEAASDEDEVRTDGVSARDVAPKTPLVASAAAPESGVLSALSTPTPSSRRSAQHDVDLTPISPLEFATPRSTTVSFPEASFPPNLLPSAVFSIGSSDRPDEGISTPRVDKPTTPLSTRDSTSPFPMLQKQPSVETVKPVALRPATAEFQRGIRFDDLVADQDTATPARDANLKTASTTPKRQDTISDLERARRLVLLAKRLQLRDAFRRWTEYVQHHREGVRHSLLAMWFWRWNRIMQQEIARQKRHAESLANLEMPELFVPRRKRQASFDAEQEPQVKRGQLFVVPHVRTQAPSPFEPVHLSRPEWLYTQAINWSTHQQMLGCVPLPVAQLVGPALYKNQLNAVHQLREELGSALQNRLVDWPGKLCWKLLLASSARLSGQMDSRACQRAHNVVRTLLANQAIDDSNSPEWIGFWEENALVQGKGFNAVTRPVAVSVRDCATDYRDMDDLATVLLGAQGVLFVCGDWVLDRNGTDEATQAQQDEDVQLFAGLLDDLSEMGADLTVLPIHVLVLGVDENPCHRELQETEQHRFEAAIDLTMVLQPTYSVLLVPETELPGSQLGALENVAWCISEHFLSSVCEVLQSLAARAPTAPMIERNNICGWLWKLVEQVFLRYTPRTDNLAIHEYLSLVLGEFTSLVEKCELQVRRYIEKSEPFRYPAFDFAIDIPAADVDDETSREGDATFLAVEGALWAEDGFAFNYLPVDWDDEEHSCAEELLFALQAVTPAEWTRSDSPSILDTENAHEQVVAADSARVHGYIKQLKSLGWNIATESVELLLGACSSGDLSMATQGLLCAFSGRLAQMAQSYDRTGYLPAETWAVPPPDSKYWRLAQQSRHRKPTVSLEDTLETPNKSGRQPKRMRVTLATPTASMDIAHVQTTDDELPDYDDDAADDDAEVPQIVLELRGEYSEQQQLNSWLEAELAIGPDAFAPYNHPGVSATPSKAVEALTVPGGITSDYLTALEKERKDFDELMRRLKRGYTLPEPATTAPEKQMTDTEDNSDDNKDSDTDLIGEWLGTMLREGHELRTSYSADTVNPRT